MRNTTWQDRLYAQLAREAQQSARHRHVAFLAAGWLSLFWVRPHLRSKPAASFMAVVGGGVLLVVALVLLAPLLNILRPALRWLGGAPAATWPVAALVGLNAWRYCAGRKLLEAFSAQHLN